MALVTVKRADGEMRDLEITLASLEPADDPARIVDRMFDVNGSETHDPIEAVEVEVEGELRLLRVGDRITMRVDVN